MKPLRLVGWPLVALALVALPACSGRPNNSSDKYGKYTLLGTYYDQVDPNKAKDNAADVLTQLQGESNVCLIGLWAYNPPAILAAVKAARKEGKVHVVGFDEDEITLQGIRDGYIHATVVQQPFEFGYQAIKIMAQALAGDRSGIPPNKQVFIPTKVIKKDNVEEFTKQINQLRGR